MPALKMSKKQRHIKQAVENLQKYIGTYDQQHGYCNYSEDMLIKDVLYGLGIALDEKYRFANGFEEFKKVLAKHIAL